MKWSKPLLSTMEVVASSSLALMAITGSRLHCLPAATSASSKARNLRTASSPSITGICRSMSTSEKADAEAGGRLGLGSRCLRASEPLTAVVTVKPSRVRLREVILRMGMESSTTRMAPFLSWLLLGFNRTLLRLPRGGCSLPLEEPLSLAAPLLPEWLLSRWLWFEAKKTPVVVAVGEEAGVARVKGHRPAPLSLSISLSFPLLLSFSLSLWGVQWAAASGSGR
mmetsp:Transcript_3411/g.5106  ORF Transcript_3411/g.5106 Transcript_3411/m.5106 type:complete len:225 (+) Transcript_3411:852-1526(+)